MTPPPRARRPRPPLDAARLGELALAYVSRFATSRARLERYLVRKLKERGWDGEGEPAGAASASAQRMVELGYVDDRAFAASRARSLGARGMGPRRLAADLAASGIAEDDRADAAIDEEASALAFARRKRIGPFALEPADRPQREKQLAAMARAGHRLALARRIVDSAPGDDPSM